AAQAFFQPAYSGLLPQTVPEALISDARALTQFVEELAFLVGPALATALILGIGAWEAFALDAASFVISAVLLSRVRPRPRGEAKPVETVAHELRAGWREVRSRAWVWVTIVAFSGALLFVYSQWYALAPIIARDTYGGAGVFGLLEAVAGAGAVLGAVTGIKWKPEHPLRAGLMMVMAWPLENGLFALGSPLPLVAACSFATGFGFSLLIIWWETALARHIPANALSRVSAYDWMGSAALLPVGYLVAGPLASAFGARTVMGVGAVIGLGLLALALVPRSTRELGDGRPVSRERAVPPRGEAFALAEEIPREIPVEAGSEA
ncbi:MAG: MFS transporter, partial [Actinomycetota bacterium]|nr:MFS transporter [Actinomycetota bacterium]